MFTEPQARGEEKEEKEGPAPRLTAQDGAHTPVRRCRSTERRGESRAGHRVRVNVRVGSAKGLPPLQLPGVWPRGELVPPLSVGGTLGTGPESALLGFLWEKAGAQGARSSVREAPCGLTAGRAAAEGPERCPGPLPRLRKQLPHPRGPRRAEAAM